MNNRYEPIAVSQDEWDEIHECIFCSECELRNGCKTEPNFGCQAEEKKRRASEAKSAWQPFGSEPGDGTEFLAWRADAGVMICWWADIDDQSILLESGGDDLTADPPSHWMPLPDGPEDEDVDD